MQGKARWQEFTNPGLGAPLRPPQDGLAPPNPTPNSPPLRQATLHPQACSPSPPPRPRMMQAQVPLNEMFGYSTGLRSMTQVST